MFVSDIHPASGTPDRKQVREIPRNPRRLTGRSGCGQFPARKSRYLHQIADLRPDDLLAAIPFHLPQPRRLIRHGLQMIHVVEENIVDLFAVRLDVARDGQIDQQQRSRRTASVELETDMRDFAKLLGTVSY